MLLTFERASESTFCLSAQKALLPSFGKQPLSLRDPFGQVQVAPAPSHTLVIVSNTLTFNVKLLPLPLFTGLADLDSLRHALVAVLDDVGIFRG